MRQGRNVSIAAANGEFLAEKTRTRRKLYRTLARRSNRIDGIYCMSLVYMVFLLKTALSLLRLLTRIFRFRNLCGTMRQRSHNRQSARHMPFGSTAYAAALSPGGHYSASAPRNAFSQSWPQSLQSPGDTSTCQSDGPLPNAKSWVRAITRLPPWLTETCPRWMTLG